MCGIFKKHLLLSHKNGVKLVIDLKTENLECCSEVLGPIELLDRFSNPVYLLAANSGTVFQSCWM